MPDLESNALAAIMRWLAKLADNQTRRRVLTYLLERYPVDSGRDG